MPRRQINSQETAILEKLRNAVHGIARPFVCGGSVVPKTPVRLRLKSGEVAFEARRSAAEQHTALQPLLSLCRQAPFGKGSRTLYDPFVRLALELKAKAGGFSVAGFDPAVASILEEARRQLCPQDTNPLVAELYNLNVYGCGGHFVPHKDTPRGADMLGTLVVCLPSSFHGGKLVISHGSARKVFDWGREISRQDEPSRIHWAAFFGDVDHSIEEVRSGRRVTLTYILRRGEGATHAPAPPGASSELLEAAFEQALQDSRFFTRGVTLGFACFHMYSRQAAFLEARTRRLTAQTVRRLKGCDYDVAAAAMRAGLAVTLEPYLTESCGGERWRLKKFPSTANRRLLSEQLTPWGLERALPTVAHSEENEDLGVTWVLPPPGTDTPLQLAAPSGAMPTAAGGPCSELLHSCEYSATGYFGNEGSDSDFYLYAALHVAIPSRGKAPGRRAGADLKPSGAKRRNARRRRTV